VSKFYCTYNDIWSSRGHDSVLSLTTHFITEDDFSRNHCLLQAGKFNTADNIVSMFTDFVLHWGIQIICVLRDGRSNFGAGLNRAGVTNVAHNLHCVVHDGIMAQKDIQDLLAAGRIVGHYKYSNMAFHALQKIQAQLELKVCTPYQDEPTRWNSSYYMPEESCKCCKCRSKWVIWFYTFSMSHLILHLLNESHLLNGI